MAHPHPPAAVSARKIRVCRNRTHGPRRGFLISSGCIISGGSLKNCVVSPDVRVNSYTEIENSILFSHVNVGRSCRIRKAIIDRNVHIPEGTSVGYDTEADRERYFVTDSGITIVTRDYSLFENPVAVDYFTSE